MRQRPANFPSSSPTQDFQQKGSWYTTDPNFAAQAPPFYTNGQPAMMLPTFPGQAIAFQSYQPTYAQQVPYQQFQTYRTEPFYQSEDPAQMMVFKPAVAPPQPVAQPARTYQSATPTTTRSSTQPQIVVQQVPQPAPPPPPPPPQVQRVEKAQMNTPSVTFDVSTQPRFDNLKYPIPGCFSIIQRGNLPGVHIVPV